VPIKTKTKHPFSQQPSTTIITTAAATLDNATPSSLNSTESGANHSSTNDNAGMLIEGTFRVPPEDNANGQEQQAAAGTFRIEVNLAGGDPQEPQQHAPAPLPAPAEDVPEPAPEPPAAEVNSHSLLSFNSQTHSYIPVQPPPWQPVNGPFDNQPRIIFLRRRRRRRRFPQ
jgi:hypothetical protein